MLDHAEHDVEERTQVATVPGMGHAFADEPGVEPAPQTPDAAAVDHLAVQWFQRFGL
jgi:hypothetical protein